MGLGMIRQLASFIALSIFLTQESWAQEGFVSLECCGQSNYSDPQTTIKWIPDNEFLQTYSRCENITLPVSNDTSQKHLRVFDTDSITQWCYTLPTIKKRNYLIRGTFLHGFALRTSPDISFNVSIGPSTIGKVVSSSDFPVVEAIFKADDENVDFCLVRGDGNPYISMVELRPLSETLYPESNSDAILKLLSRVDVGNKARPIRYPQDRSDRIWTTDTSGRTPVTSADGSNLSSNSTISYVPAEVLETAALNTDRLQFSYSSSDTGKHDYLILLHFFELEPNVTKGQRVFDIYVNRKLMNASFDIQQHANKYKRIVFRVHETNGSLNISLVKVPDSMYGPICNAYEIFQVLKRKLGTQQKDLNAIMEVRNELRRTNPENLLLESWSGDPCLPSTWKGLVCRVKNEITVITKLDLSSSELQGPLPTAISELADLTELNVRNNDFTGSIPESFSSLQHLANLSYGCNRHLKTELPPDLSNQSKITTDKGICIDKSSSSSQISHTSIIGSVLGGSAFFLLIGVIFTCFCRRSQHMDVTKAVMTKNAVFSIPSVDGIVVKPIRIQIFTLKTIESATNQFKTMIGEGGFGAVYRGTLLDGQEVAVKVRSATSTQGTREFENELNLLTTIRHENLIPLLGYCCENDQQILVYPFMSNGSLQDRLYGDASKRKVLDWPTRLSIALGAARGLLYLHTYSGRSIIHRDVKSSNILLDNRMCAKVADFGFSKYAPQEGDSGVSLEVRGTAGYLDPEYYSTQHLSAKSDVFSYGVVLLEIITGREPLNIHRPRNEWSLIEWAKPFLLGSKIEEIVDPSIKSGYHAEAMWRVAEAALLCIEPFSTYRPSMEEIVRELEDALIIENNASEYMKSIESLGGSNRYFSIERKALAVTTTPTEPSPVPSQPMAPPEPR